MKWLKYQLAYIKCKRSCVVKKGRQEGYTTAAAFKAVINRVFKQNNCVYSATDERLAKDFIDLCETWAKDLNISIISRTALELGLDVGTKVKIIGVSSNPAALRGMRNTDAIIDEYASHEAGQGQELYDAVMPLSTHGGTIDFISTIATPYHKHEELFNHAEELGLERFRVDVYDAVEQGLADIIYRKNHGKIDKPVEDIRKEFIENLKATAGASTWDREYLCKMPESGLGLIGSELYNSLMVKKWSSGLTGNYHPLYCGWDIGRSKDLSVIWVVEYFDNKARLVAIKELSNVPYQIQLEEAIKIVGHNNMHKCCVDAGAIGSQLAEDLVRKFGTRVEKVFIGHSQKKDMFDRLQKWAEQARLELPDDPRIKEDICSMRRVFTPAGTEQYEGGTAFSHADFACSCALAIMAIPEQKRAGSFYFGKANMTPQQLPQHVMGRI
jgi:phage FluMu gp28-like protein